MKLKNWMACILAAMVTGCASSTPTSNKEVLRIGMSLNLPPLCHEVNGQPAGLEADFAKQLATELGREPRFVVMDFDALIPALENGRVDIIMSGMSITRLRSLNIRFCEPYIRIGQMALVHSRNYSMYANIRSMPILARSVAVIKGSTGEALARKVFSKSQITAMDDVRKAAKKLAEGDLDVIIADAPLLVEMAADHEADGLQVIPTFLNREELAWGVGRESAQLQGEINDVIQEWKANGMLDEFIDRWIPYAKKFKLEPLTDDD